MDTGKRTLIKALLWQATGLLSMGVAGYLYTGSLSAGSALAAINAAVGLVLYVTYERIWARIGWGRG